ncbi:SusD/RagB family nutrient-binding outer membrane lipoprotein [Mucilaginibacter sp. OK098]|uniref:SusD/RagB family nutrient-binding outer membrane lipoprotein n=1 Tax=Mucilaginibacter sp. OK098 TaxID=1855297 RepID=UPI00091348C5|nr:SusD/RagB family nutrient-binding outer membrane lipoprotein [Mucilaginibacter sp. OK098]SHM43880.1 Starch-binding associating with outer membrane [Mucilaginibacter sp. OK098]
MKKRILIFAAAALLTACTKDITKLNIDPKHPVTVPSYALFTQAQNQMAINMTSVSENDNIFRLIEQQWTEVQYLTESQYNIPGRSIADNVWDEFYTGPLANFEKAKSAMKIDVTDAGKLKNELAITDIGEVYCFYYLVTTFGNIPYSEAFSINTTLFPKYDDASTIYTDLLKRLDADIANLDPSASSFGSADMIYGGSAASWKKFANTFKLKMGILLADSDPVTAKATITSAISGGIFTSNSDNALYKFSSSPPYTNAAWVGLVQGGRFDYVATDTYMTLLGSQNATDATIWDKRTPYYFAQNKLGNYVGAPNAVGTILFSNYSLPSGSELTKGNSTGQAASIGNLANADTPGDLLDYSETQFYLAEAVARGFITGDAAAYYKNGITASFVYWTGSDAGANDIYTANPIGSGQAAQLQAIAAQQYLALYNRGYDAWTVNRRLDYPVLIPPPSAISDFPVRFTYPNKEQQINSSNYQAASTAIGGDVVTTKLWFDKK